MTLTARAASLCLAAVATGGAVTQTQAQVPPLEPVPVGDTVRSEILAFVTSYYDAFSDRDWERFRAHFWPQATLTSVWQPPGADEPSVVVSTVDAFVRLAPEGPGSREIFEERMVAADVQVHGDLASVFARYHARFGDPGEVMEWEGMDAFSLMRHGGEWRIVALAYAAD